MKKILLPFLCGMKLCENELESCMLFYLGVGSVLGWTKSMMKIGKIVIAHDYYLVIASWSILNNKDRETHMVVIGQG